MPEYDITGLEAAIEDRELRIQRIRVQASPRCALQSVADSLENEVESLRDTILELRASDPEEVAAALNRIAERDEITERNQKDEDDNA